MKILNLPVEDAIAEVYDNASAREKSKVNSAINMMLAKFFKKNDSDGLSQLMAEMAAESLKNGLTMEKLGELMEWDNETIKNLFGQEYSPNAQ